MTKIELLKENEELKKQLKEKECFPQKKDGTIDTCEVMKENEELKWEQKQILEDNDNYQKENEELKGQIKWLEKCKLELGDLLGEKNKEAEELKKAITEKNSVIEKMKCWANCIKSLNCSQININSTTVVRVCKNCKDWELAK